MSGSAPAASDSRIVSAGPAGILDSGVAGLILGGAYLLSGRVLWTSILAHGFIDTFGMVALYFGWDS